MDAYRNRAELNAAENKIVRARPRIKILVINRTFMKKLEFLCAGAFLGGFSALAVAPVFAQPLPLERAMPQVNGLSLQEVTPDEAEKLAMPANGIALHLQDVTLTEALDELQKQSGVKLDYGWADKNTLDKRVSVDMETRYFQPAFDAIMDEAGVKASLQRFGRADAYNVQFGRIEQDKTTPLLSGVGSFQLRLQNVKSDFNQTVNVSADKKAVRSQTRRVTIGFDGKADPIVNVIGAPLVTLTRVEDDKGRSLLDAKANQQIRFGFDNGYFTEISQNIQTPAADAKMLARVEGTAIYVVPSARQQWEIADILGKTDLTHEFESSGRTITVTVKSAERAENSNSVNLSLEMSAPPQGNNAGELDPLFSFGQMAKAFTLQDANGNIFRMNGYSGNSSNGKMTMNGPFNLVAKPGALMRLVLKPRAPGDPNHIEVAPTIVIAEPIKLVFDGPVEFVQTPVPFSFSDVPLP